MPAQQPTFETKDRKRLYEFVDSRGGVTFDELLESDLLRDPDRYRQLVAVMKRDGLLAEEDGVLETALEAGVEEPHETPAGDVTIRAARQEDISGVVGVMRQVADDRRYIVAEDVAAQLAGDSTLVREDLEDRRFFVATLDDEVVAWCGVERPTLEKLAHNAELTLGVLEEFRGSGIGSHLMEHALSWAKERGFHKVYNSVPATNPEGIEFLEDHGWEEEAVRRDHYRIDDEFVDEVMMAVELEA
jgi:ribosomal protein S18 acetylase RimI-like enzyme